MNSDTSCRCGISLTAYAAAIVGAALIVGALVCAMQYYVKPAPVGTERAEVRAAALRDLRAAEAEALANPAWVDQAKGIVRLPIQDAMALVERSWGKDPAAARADLIARVEKATAQPPKAPEKPSALE